MPTLVSNVVTGILGVGAVTAAIAAPVSLAVNGERSQKTQTAQEMQQALPSATASAKDVGTNNLKKDCYGGFLSQEGIGELVFCLEKKNNEKERLDFYLYWTKDGKKELTPIEKINVNAFKEIQFEIWLVRRGETVGEKKIIVDKEGQDNLNWMDSQILKNICTRNTQDSSNVYLSCNYTFTNEFFNQTYTYKHSITEFKLEQ